MSRHSLPEHPDLGQLRRQAKELRRSALAGDRDAIERLLRHADADPATVTLSMAQLVIAREFGFASWPRLKQALEIGTARAIGNAGAPDGFARAFSDADDPRCRPAIAELPRGARAQLDRIEVRWQAGFRSGIKGNARRIAHTPASDSTRRGSRGQRDNSAGAIRCLLSALRTAA
jgi:hypothetical protein